MQRIHAEAEEPSLRALAASVGAAGRLSKSTIGNILRGRRPTAEQLSALLAAYGAGPETTAGMLAAHRPIRRAQGARCLSVRGRRAGRGTGRGSPSAGGDPPRTALRHRSRA
ncbi:helix-turn-helix domain-containing protein [Streptomyces nigra]|uniref:helix-turn-helix domain-containing protein n=1 Tax=Streptomyces nigra TaxID=1827580 RepID=UPI0037F73C86